MKSKIFLQAEVEAATALMAPITQALTDKTRSALERGETPPLVGALTMGDLARWIENARAKKKSRKGRK
jgi:hypothetical protein